MSVFKLFSRHPSLASISWKAIRWIDINKTIFHTNSTSIFISTEFPTTLLNTTAAPFNMSIKRKTRMEIRIISNKHHIMVIGFLSIYFFFEIFKRIVSMKYTQAIWFSFKVINGVVYWQIKINFWWFCKLIFFPLPIFYGYKIEENFCWFKKGLRKGWKIERNLFLGI